MADTIDLGGNTLVVNGLRVGATAPGQAGTELSGSEIALLDGLTAGAVTASKAVVVDANSDITGFGDVGADSVTIGTFSMTGPVGAATAAGTGAGSAGHADGAVATHVLTVDVNGTTYYIPLCNTNA